MSRWLGLAGFIASISLAAALVVGAFLFDIYRTPRLDRHSMKDCFGPVVPKELKTLQVYGSPVTSVRAASSHGAAKTAMIEVGRQASIWLPGRQLNEDQPSAEDAAQNAGAIVRRAIAQNSGKIAHAYREAGENPGIKPRYGYVAFRVSQPSVVRIAAASDVDMVQITHFSQSDSEIKPIRFGRLPCELRFVSDYQFEPNLYVARIFTTARSVRLIVTPAETEWQKSWN